jgi:transcriptional regulator with XRE-family HTH domain
MSDTKRTYVTELQRILREERLRQDWLAMRAGMDEGQISKYVRGLHRPGERNARRIAAALGRNDVDALALFDAPTVH